MYPASDNSMLAREKTSRVLSRAFKLCRCQVTAFWLMHPGSIENRTLASDRRIAMRGIAPIPFTKSCFPHGCHAKLPFLHLISVRTELVRAESYYILWLMASKIQDVARRR